MKPAAAAIACLTVLLAACSTSDADGTPASAQPTSTTDPVVCRTVAKWVDGRPEHESLDHYIERAEAITAMDDALLVDAAPELRDAVWELADAIESMTSGDGNADFVILRIQSVDRYCDGINHSVLG